MLIRRSGASDQRRKTRQLSLFQLLVAGVFLAVPAWVVERHMMQSLVPDDKLVEARAEMKCSGLTVALAFLRGAMAGMVAGLLFASKPGEETRRALKGYARKPEEEVLEKVKEARAALDLAIERGERFLAEKTADVEAAVKAGGESTKEIMDKCCS